MGCLITQENCEELPSPSFPLLLAGISEVRLEWVSDFLTSPAYAQMGIKQTVAALKTLLLFFCVRIDSVGE